MIIIKYLNAKRLFYVVFILLIFLSIGCDKVEKVSKDENVISYNGDINNKKKFDEIINEFIIDSDNEYFFDIIPNELENSYLLIYDIYEKKDFKCDDCLPIATFSVYFENKSDEAVVFDLLYTFPIKENEKSDNLKFEYNLYKTLVNALISNNNKKDNKILTFFQMNTYEDYENIINNKTKYDFKEIYIGENEENYMSTLFINYNKSITFEYHDAKFIEYKYKLKYKI